VVNRKISGDSEQPLGFERLRPQCMSYLAGYLIVGIALCGILALIGRARGKKDFTPLSMPLLIGFGPAAAIVGLLFWPVWFAIQVIEWSSSRRPAEPHFETSRELVPRGTQGHAVTDLKPGGKVRIDGALIDGLAESGFIDAGKEIEVVGRTLTGVRVKKRVVATPNPAEEA
jgi:membrane-bound ClpP family serine protease